MDRSKIQGLVNELDDAAIKWATALDEERPAAWARLENARRQVTLALAEPVKRRKPGALNRWGNFICELCRNDEHPGTSHGGLCSCTCDGRHDSKGNLLF